MIRSILFLFFCLPVATGYSQLRLNSKNANVFFDTLITREIQRAHLPGCIVSLVYSDSVIVEKGWGFSSIKNKLLVDDSTLFELGSVGKIFTAISVLQLVKQGKLDLHRDVNTYLKEFKIKNPYSTPVTLFHLLTHTAGFDDRFFGYMALNSASIQQLDEHLKERMPNLFTEPGKQINYSNYSYALAGYLVELASGESFADYVHRHILTPLSMTHTTYFYSDAKEKPGLLATGYRIVDVGEEIPSLPRHTLPSGSIISTTSDMTNLLVELLRPSGKVLSDDIRQALFSRQFSNHTLLMGYSLGFEEQLNNGILGFGKGGSVPGFLSAIYVEPKTMLGLFVATNTQTDNFMEYLGNSFFATFYPPAKCSRLTYVDIDLQRYAGVYRDARYNHHSLEDLFALYQGKFELYESGDSAITCYHNDAWHIYRPINDSVFYNTMNQDERIVFSFDDSGRVKGLSRNVKIGMLYLPVTAERVPWYDDPKMINEYYFLVLVFIFSFVFVILFRIWVVLKRRSNKGYLCGKLLSNGSTAVMTIVMVSFFIHFVAAFLFIFRHVSDFFVALPISFATVQRVTYFFPPLAVLVVFCAAYEWRTYRLPIRTKVYYSLLSVCVVVHVIFLWRWHFIGLNY